MYTALAKLNNMTNAPEKLVVFEVKTKKNHSGGSHTGTLKLGFSQDLEFPFDSVTWSSALSLSVIGDDPNNIKIVLHHRFVELAFFQ